jgi:uncharacterized protein
VCCIQTVTPVSHVTVNGREATAELLLTHGADIEAKDIEGRTALRWAAEKILAAGKWGTYWAERTTVARAPTAKLLLEKGADVDATDNNGRTALSCAVENGLDAVAEVILAHTSGR